MTSSYCGVFTFLWRSLQAMGGFFDCFRVRNDPRRPRPRLVPTSSPPPPTGEERQKIRLSSLFSSEVREECVVKDTRENLVRRLGRSDIDEDLLEEAKLLKACGTLPETPAEIRKAVTFCDKIEISEMRTPHSALSFSPETPNAIQQAETLHESLERSDLQRPQSNLETSPQTPDEIQDAETFAQKLEKSDVEGPRTVIKSSPYPTPRKITDDMQTPGTVFATNMKVLFQGNARIRSQYVYTVSNPIENQLEELKEEYPVLHEPSEHEEENLLDVPIIGLVATHWNPQEETSNISPKPWDGNGIPNSTTKYKEDQKVCWHATPFEERLEKALSEETVAPQRKSITGSPILFEDMGGQDTATSQLQSITCPSVVSF